MRLLLGVRYRSKRRTNRQGQRTRTHILLQRKQRRRKRSSPARANVGWPWLIVWRRFDSTGGRAITAAMSSLTRNRAVDIAAPWDLGGFSCKSKWKEFYCDIAVNQLSFENLNLQIKGSTFLLGEAMRQLPLKASLRVKFDADWGTQSFCSMACRSATQRSWTRPGLTPSSVCFRLAAVAPPGYN